MKFFWEARIHEIEEKMGYATSYRIFINLSLEKQAELLYEYFKRIEFAEESRLKLIVESMITSDGYYMKWYDHDEDLKTMSSENPDLIFTLIGEGEESDDKWRKTYQNGKLIKHQKTELIWVEVPIPCQQENSEDQNKLKWSREAAEKELEMLILGIPEKLRDVDLKEWIIPGEFGAYYVRGTRVSVSVILNQALLDSWDMRSRTKTVEASKSFYPMIYEIINMQMPTIDENGFAASLLFAQKNLSVLDKLDYSDFE